MSSGSHEPKHVQKRIPQRQNLFCPQRFAASVVMVTGTWSRRIAEANERNPNGLNVPAMAGASIVLIAVVGLGIRLKLQVLGSFMHDMKEYARRDHERRVDEAQRASRVFFGQGEWKRRASGHRFGGTRAEQSAEMHRSESVLKQQRVLLGVQPGAKKAELKRAYYRAAKRHHPDTSGQASASSTPRFAELKAAYDMLLEHAPDR